MVIHAESAIPKRMKRTVLTQEVLRVMLHTSRNLPWEVVRDEGGRREGYTTDTETKGLEPGSTDGAEGKNKKGQLVQSGRIRLRPVCTNHTERQVKKDVQPRDTAKRTTSQGNRMNGTNTKERISTLKSLQDR